jgi:ATP-dependent Lon protease
MSPESGVLRTYLEWIADLPWSDKSEDNSDIGRAEQILDEDHYNMKKPKERVLDFLAVRQLQEKSKGPILCFVGPPGTGKTSLGRSLARAMNREFIRVSLGGVRDEAEIRGHRKTYVGALPGKIIQSMRKAGTVNPVFLLDEIDKLSSDFRGDPASALLEVLDPEQNSTFIDHYLEVPYDLSSIMFITTANSLHSVPYALRDRMEVIEIPGYTDQEKERIARQFIIPKQLKENGLDWANVTFRRKALMRIIREYTMESGVRNLERQIAAVIRKVARSAVRKGYVPGKEEQPPRFGAAITDNNLSSYLGPPQYEPDLVYRQVRPGLAHGLAWTELGGKLLPVEISLLPGEGKLILTGSLGDVMKESAQIGLSFLRSNADTFGIHPEFQKETDIHIHVPQGAIPKDGPSAGITIIAALLSTVADTPVRSCTAMTGEVTLTGRLLAVGGIKEKVLAAHRNGLQTVLLPEENRKDLEELPGEIRDEISFMFADSVRDALLALFPRYFSVEESRAAAAGGTAAESASGKEASTGNNACVG